MDKSGHPMRLHAHEIWGIRC